MAQAHSDTVMADALKDYANTEMSTKEIADKYGVSPSTLTVWARRASVPLRGRGRSKLLQPDSRTRAILALSEVLVQEKVGQRFDMTKQRVAKIMRRWKDWKSPRQSPFVPDDQILWKGKIFTVVESGLLFGKVRDEKGQLVHNFYWNLGGSLAVKVDAETVQKLRSKPARSSKKRVPAAA